MVKRIRGVRIMQDHFTREWGMKSQDVKAGRLTPPRIDAESAETQDTTDGLAV